MLEFFKNIFRKLKNSLNQEKYMQSYKELINIFRRVTPLEIQDVDNIHTILRGVAENTAALDLKMKILKNSLRNKALLKTKYDQFIKDEFRKISKRAKSYDRDVSYSIGGKIVYGEVSSDEERGYFSRENVENLNSIPLRPKKCDFDCQRNECRACIERRLRMEISKKLEIENQQLINDKVKKRKTSKDPITELNKKLGVPVLFGRYVSDDAFKVDDLPEEERQEFLVWKEEQKKSAEVARHILNLSQTQGAAFPERSGVSRQAETGARNIEKKAMQPEIQVVSPNLELVSPLDSPLQASKDVLPKLEDQPIVQELSNGTVSPVTSASSEDEGIKPDAPRSFTNPFRIETGDASDSPLASSPSFTSSAPKVSNFSFSHKITEGSAHSAGLTSSSVFNNPFSKAGNMKDAKSPFETFQNSSAKDGTNQMLKLKSDSELRNPFSTFSSGWGAVAENAPFDKKIDNPFVDQKGGFSNPFSASQGNGQTSSSPFTYKMNDGPSASQFSNPFAADRKPIFSADSTRINTTPSFAQLNSHQAHTFSGADVPFQPGSPNVQQENLERPMKLEPSKPDVPIPQPNPCSLNSEITSRFSNQNIFQSDRTEKDDAGLFAAADQPADDSFGRRRKAFRKR